MKKKKTAARRATSLEQSKRGRDFSALIQTLTTGDLPVEVEELARAIKLMALCKIKVGAIAFDDPTVLTRFKSTIGKRLGLDGPATEFEGIRLILAPHIQYGLDTSQIAKIDHVHMRRPSSENPAAP